MCKAIEDMRAEAKAKGRAEGREEGRAEGREEGRAEGNTERILTDLKNVMDSINVSEICCQGEVIRERGGYH